MTKARAPPMPALPRLYYSRGRWGVASAKME